MEGTLSTAGWATDPIHLVLLSLLLWLQVYRTRAIQTLRGKSTPRIFGHLRLQHLSYCVIGCGLCECVIRMLSRLFPLSDASCFYVEHTTLTLSLLTHFGVHLFVALRSRLSSIDSASPLILQALGALLILSDVCMTAYSWTSA